MFLGGLFSTFFRTKIVNNLQKLIKDTVRSYQNHFGISQGQVHAKHTIRMHDFELLTIYFPYLDLSQSKIGLNWSYFSIFILYNPTYALQSDLVCTRECPMGDNRGQGMKKKTQLHLMLSISPFLTFSRHFQGQKPDIFVI